MNGKKIVKISVGVVGALLLMVLLIFLFWLGPTVKLIAQKVGSKALGTPLTIDTLSINPKNGTIHLSDFAIANQDTFGKSNAVSLASLDISIDIGSIFTRTVVVHQVSINSPYFVYEQSSASDNIYEFVASIQEFVGYDPAAPPPPPNPKKLEKERKKSEKKARKKKEKGPKIVVVESLAINDVRFHLANTDDGLLDFDAGFGQLLVSTTNGTVQLDNFFVSNPGRLETPNLFTLEQFEILLEPGTIYSTNINIHEVNIRKPHAFVEYNPKTDTLGEFLKIASGLAAKIPTNAPKATATNEVVVAEAGSVEPPPPPPEVMFGSLTIDDVQLHVVNIGDPDLSVHLGLNQLAVAMDKGTINLDNLFLTNPKRLDTPNLFSLDSIAVDFEADSLKADTLMIEDVQVLKPHAFLELNKEANTVGEFMKIANGFLERMPTYPIPKVPQSAPGTAPEEAGEQQPTADGQTAPPLALTNLLVDDIQIKLLDTSPTNNVPDEPRMLAGIGEISIKLVDGKLRIKGISVPNVEGFHATNIFHLANIDIALDPASLFSDQVVIEKVFINSPNVNLEQTEESGNVAALQTTLMNFVPPTPEQPDAEEPQVAETKEPEAGAPPVLLSEQPVVLHQLLITNLLVNLKLPVSTNAPPSGSMGLMDVGKLNPMDKLSMDKLNPLSAGGDEEGENDPDAPMTLVAFNQLSLEPLKGLLHIDGMRVSNPPGFTRRDLVNIEELRIDLDPDTLQADTLVIEDILVSRPRIRYERQIMSDNVKALQKEIEQATMRRDEYMDEEGEEKKQADTVAETSGEEEDEGQKVIIDHILIASGMVQAKLSALPVIPVPLPDIELKDIGREEGGASAAEASTQVFDTFYESMIGAIGNTTGFAGDTLKGIGSFGMDALGNVTDGLGNAVDGRKKVAKDVVEETRKKRKSRGAGGRRRLF
jgi:hypothetical protein